MKKIDVWQVKKSKVLFKNKWMQLRRDKVVSPKKMNRVFDIIQKNPAVLIIPKIGNKFVLVEQYRHAVKQKSIEFPQGHVEENENILIAAKRELKEETGITSKKISNIGSTWLAPGHNTQIYYHFLAENCKIGKADHEKSEEDIKIISLSQKEIEKFIDSNVIKDSPTITAYYLFQSKHRAE